mmetsp:Transcript_16799/g.37783  ORF Transcript_16799/g.37783 Transcript_16799/m.37783 type:complete len:88 (-) Transcript_16799:22-285(-)
MLMVFLHLPLRSRHKFQLSLLPMLMVFLHLNQIEIIMIINDAMICWSMVVCYLEETSCILLHSVFCPMLNSSWVNDSACTAPYILIY